MDRIVRNFQCKFAANEGALVSKHWKTVKPALLRRIVLYYIVCLVTIEWLVERVPRILIAFDIFIVDIFFQCFIVLLFFTILYFFERGGAIVIALSFRNVLFTSVLVQPTMVLLRIDFSGFREFSPRDFFFFFVITSQLCLRHKESLQVIVAISLLSSASTCVYILFRREE